MSTTEGRGQEETIEIKKSIVIDASPAVVFKAITDPNELANWFPDQGEKLVLINPGSTRLQVTRLRTIKETSKTTHADKANKQTGI